MVQNQKRRRTSLILGALLALLLGAAVGFFVLAMPVHMLETVTTVSRLSKLMVQAEPPISPNDRTLLAVLAGILAAGIGWVLVDWLLFGKVAMRTLIREREDEYEEEDEDAFRPTDPLDLVAPGGIPVDDWNSPSSGDARRPLSARTDIGDPPLPVIPAGMTSAAVPGIDELMPALSPISLTMGSSTPPLQPNAAPFLPTAVFPAPVAPEAPIPQAPAAQPPIPQSQSDVFGGLPTAGGVLPSSWPPLDLPLDRDSPAASPLPQPMSVASPVQPLSGGTGWLPVPGAPAPLIEEDADADATLPTPVVAAEPAAPIDAPSPSPLIPDPFAFSPPPAVPAPDHFFAPPPAPFESAEAETVAANPFFAPPSPPVAVEPPALDATQEPPPAVEPTPPEPVAPPPVAEPAPVAQAAPVAQPAPAAPTGNTIAGLDRDRLEDLLERLERGLQARRAAANALPAPAPAAPEPAPQRSEPPAGYAQRPFEPSPEPVDDLPAMSQQSAPPIPQVTPPAPTLADLAQNRGDALLDQPLHVTLDLLRNMVKR